MSMSYNEPLAVEFTDGGPSGVFASAALQSVPLKGDRAWFGQRPSEEYEVTQVEWCIPAGGGAPGAIVTVRRITADSGD